MPTTDAPWGLLVIPSDDLRGMLDEGPCGFRPPMAWYCEDYRAWEQWHRGMDHAEPCAWAAMVERARCALALRWEGQDMPHGWLAAAWATGVAVTLHSKGPSAGEAFLPGMHLRALRERGCTLIALDEQGREVGQW